MRLLARLLVLAALGVMLLSQITGFSLIQSIPAAGPVLAEGSQYPPPPPIPMPMPAPPVPPPDVTGAGGPGYANLV